MHRFTVSRVTCAISLLIGIVLLLSLPASATMQPRERYLLSDNLDKTFRMIQRIHRLTSEMDEQARPFLRPNFARRYRFEPDQKAARTILSENRLILDRMRLLAGILYHAPIPELGGLVRRFYASTEAVTTYAKRSLRAIKDHNFALYLASAQGISKESRLQADLVRQLEIMLDDTIERNDDDMENL